MPAITSGSFKIHLRMWKPAKFLSSVNAAFLFPSPHQMASDHPCNSVLELSSQWVSLLVKSSMVLPSKLDTKLAVTPSKNKPLKLVNLWCIPTAKVPVQECRGLSTGLGSIWWYIWLTSPAKATSFFLNLTKMSTMSLCNLLPGSDSLFNLLFPFCWAEPLKWTQTLVVAYSGLTIGKCRRNHSDGGFSSSSGTSQIYPLLK